jgi:hypothetical protein
MPRSAIRLRGLSLFALTIALSGGASAWAQSAAPSIAAAPEVADDTIIVTGTRRTDRTVAESAVPIDVFTPAELKTQASGDIKVIVRNLVPSFNLSRNATADGSAFVRPPTLRGLPADQVLVLINGKRFHRSALVQVNGASLNAGSQGPDLSQIPTAAIERLEVLRDGASAQYGSDAIAGVLNFTLRRNDEGLDLSSRYGQYYRGDGKDIQLSANAGFKLGDGFLNVTGEFSDVGDTNRAVQRPDAIVLQSLGFNPKEPVTRVGQPDLRAYRLFFNSAIPLGDDEVYAFGNYGWSDQVIDFNYRRPIRVVTTDIPGRPGSGVFAKSINTTYLDRNADGTWNELGRTFETSQLFPDGFTPRFRSTNLDLSLVAGYRGETDFGLSFDASAAYGQNRIRYFLSDTLNPSLGPDSPTSFYAGALEQRETNLNLDLTYPVEVGLASPLNIAGGLEYRREGFLIGLGERASWEQGIYATQTVRRADGTTFLSTKPHQRRVLSGSRSRRDRRPDPGRRRALRKLLGLRRHLQCQGECPLGPERPGRPQGCGQHRVPRPDAWAAVPQEPADRVPAGEPAAGANCDAVARGCSGAILRRRATEARKVAELQRRRRADAGRRLQPDSRLLQHHCARPHRPDRQYHRKRCVWRPGGADRAGRGRRRVAGAGALFHQRLQDAHAGGGYRADPPRRRRAGQPELVAGTQLQQDTCARTPTGGPRKAAAGGHAGHHTDRRCAQDRH